MSNGAPTMVVYGNLTADPELRFTPSGQAVANFTVASTERKYDKQAGDWVEGDTVFLRCTVWGKVAENVTETLTKGQRVILAGTLRVRQYDLKDGGKGTSVECNVEEIGPSLKWATAKVARAGGDSGRRREPERDYRDNSEPPF